MFIKNNICLVISFFLIFSENTQAQLFKKKKASHSTCEGMINITESGRYLLEFMGVRGNEKESISTYNQDSIPKNQIWASFNPKQNGKISFELSPEAYGIQFYLFEASKEKSCEEIKEGTADLKTKKVISPQSKNTTRKTFVSENKKYVFLFLSKEKRKFKVHFKFEYYPVDEKGREIIDSTVSDYTNGRAIKTYLKIINYETNKPLTSSITIKSKNKHLDGFYKASDLYLFVPKQSKSTIKIDKLGFFSKDIYHKFLTTNDTLIVLLKPLTVGSKAQFDEIQFYPGTSAMKKRAEEKVKRVADFLALNATINIEIQGHVNSKGKNTSSSIMLSKRRAKKVMKRLIQYGIDRSRLTAVGFGNAKPIYLKPKKAYQEQANRRVEIMIK